MGGGGLRQKVRRARHVNHELNHTLTHTHTPSLSLSLFPLSSFDVNLPTISVDLMVTGLWIRSISQTTVITPGYPLGPLLYGVERLTGYYTQRQPLRA